MKIVHFIDHLRPDGAQAVLKRFVSEMARRGHEQTIVCLNDSWDSALVEHFRSCGVEVRVVGKVALATGAGMLSTWRWLRQQRFDVAVTMLFVADVLGRFLARITRIPRIVTSIQSRNVDYPAWKRWLVRRTMPWADVVIICSRGMAEFVEREEGARPERIRYIPNSTVKPRDYANPVSAGELRAEFGIAPAAIVVGYLGRLVPQKGLDVLLRALAKLSTPNVHIVLMGTGGEEHRLRSLAQELGLVSQVHFAGYRRDAPRLLGAFDLYVHPSRFEGMPVALLEAMAAGCPIVATSADGNSELIHDGVHGWLVSPEDPIALARALEAALRDPGEARVRGMAAKRRAEQEFSVEESTDRWEGILSNQA